MKKIRSIEENPFKDKVRSAIVQQAKEWGEPIDAETLPAAHWLFEKALIEACPNAKITGCELDWDVYFESEKNRPKGMKLTHAPINGFHDEDTPCNFAWFDYCGTPYGGNKWGFSRIEDPARLIRKLVAMGKKGLVYVTYCMTSRFITVEEMAAKIWGNLSIEGATKRKLWSEIGVKSGQGVHLVFEAYYLGGENQKTPMITFGFQVGKQTVTPFQADWRIEVQQQRQEAHAAKYGGDFIPANQETKIASMAQEARQEWEVTQQQIKALEEQAETLRNQLKGKNLLALNDKELIRFAHGQSLNTAAIHKLTSLVPKGYLNWGGTESRHLTRRNVGATVAWL